MRAASTTTSPSSFNLLLPKHFTALVKLCLHLHSLASPLVPFPLPLQLALVSMFRSRVLSRCVPALPLAIRRHSPQFRPSLLSLSIISRRLMKRRTSGCEWSRRAQLRKEGMRSTDKTINCGEGWPRSLNPRPVSRPSQSAANFRNDLQIGVFFCVIRVCRH